MSSTTTDSPASPETVALDDSKEDNSQDESVHNLSIADRTVVNFDGTLAPGETPDGFILVDEDLNRSQPDVDPKDSEPIFKVLFKDSTVFQKYCQKIESFLKELIKQHCDIEKVKCSETNLMLEIFDAKDTFKNSSEVDSPNKQFMEKQSNAFLFTVDTKPKFKDDLDIPMYGKKFNKALQKSEEASKEVKRDFAPKMTCFNCLGNHSLRDCDKPRNYGAINKNRKEHAAKRGSTSSRYHLDDDQKFGHFIPGQISSNLRKALGIKDNDLPKHIYRMRILGYPPGWLEEARLQHSGLALFNSSGLAETGSDEEGEIVSPGDKDKYDIKKIIDFPGFNILPPHGTRDEYKNYWGSDIQEQYSKTTMLSYLISKKADDGYKRRKMPNPANLKLTTDVNPGDMDIDMVEDTPVECLPVKHLFIPPLPKDDSEPPPPPPPETLPAEEPESPLQEDVSMNSNEGSTAPSSRDGSPSLYDLERAKKEILAALNERSLEAQLDAKSSSVPKPDTLTLEVQNPNSDSPKAEVPVSDSSKVEGSGSNNVDVNSMTPVNSPKPQPMHGSGNKAVITKHLGTPLLHSCSPYRRLPSSEKFSKDICDVINFENLPDSTGKYDQMSELLQKVRTKVSEIQKE